MIRLILVFSIAFFSLAFSCTAPGSDYRCVDSLAEKATDYAIFNDKAPIVLDFFDNSCSDKPSCICVKANQIFVTEYNQFCYPYASICAIRKPFGVAKGVFDANPFTYYMDLPVTFPSDQSVFHTLNLRKAGAIQLQYVSTGGTRWTIASSLGPLISTFGYAKGSDEAKTIVRMWQPRNYQLCDKRIGVTNLLKGEFFAEPLR